VRIVPRSDYIEVKPHRFHHSRAESAPKLRISMQHFAQARILVVDDEPTVLDAYRHVLKRIVPYAADELRELAGELFTNEAGTADSPTTIAAVDFCRQGEEAVLHIEEKLGQGNFYPVAFVDIRMPPGINGLETAKRLRRLSPTMNVVVVTGYSDHPPQRIAMEIGSLDRVFYLVKPFDPDELLHLAVTLINRWNTDRLVTEEIATMTSTLVQALTMAREHEAKAVQLGQRVRELADQLQERLERSGDIITVAMESVHSERQSQAERRALSEGRAVASRSGSLSHCPYSATRESELFLAWIAGFRSVT
jgi:CheY-like chemotaxis protein